MTKNDLLGRVAERMAQRGITQNDLAKACGLSQPHISKVLAQRVKLAKKTEAKFSVWLDRGSSGVQGRPDEILHAIALRLQNLSQKRLMHFMEFLRAIEQLIVE